MNTIKLRIEYAGEISVAGEKVTGPITMTWFEHNDLVIETAGERITFNTDTAKPLFDNVYLITPATEGQDLTIVKDVDLKLARNNVAVYLIINGKHAVRMPESVKKAIPL